MKNIRRKIVKSMMALSLCISMFSSNVFAIEKNEDSEFIDATDFFGEDSFVETDVVQSHYKQVGPYYFTEYRYQAGSRKNGNSTRIYSSNGMHDENSVGEIFEETIDYYASNEELSEIPQQTAIEGYLPAGTTLTFKIDAASCGHSSKTYCGIKIDSVPSGASMSFQNYGVNTFRTGTKNFISGNEVYGNATYKIGTNDWADTPLTHHLEYDEGKGAYYDKYGNGCNDIKQEKDYPTNISNILNTDEVWILVSGGVTNEMSGLYNCGSVYMTVTYVCKVPGFYSFNTIGYSEHCNYGHNRCSFNLETSVFEDILKNNNSLTIKATYHSDDSHYDQEELHITLKELDMYIDDNKNEEVYDGYTGREIQLSLSKDEVSYVNKIDYGKYEIAVNNTSNFIIENIEELSSKNAIFSYEDGKYFVTFPFSSSESREYLNINLSLKTTTGYNSKKQINNYFKP